MADTTITSLVNHRTLVFGRLEIPSLAELRARANQCWPRGTLKLEELVADVRALHADPENKGALFQVASQFNLLEMISPSITPERGVERYESDRTQGPACAIAAGAGTIYRNYFARVNGRVGQSADNQIDCLHDIGQALGNDREQLWVMRNGYALPSAKSLGKISQRIQSLTEADRDALRQRLRVGIQWGTQVTLDNCSHLVSQAYCSAMPVAYTPISKSSWAEFAQLVLEASYEATLCAALLNSARTGRNKVFLTLLGGGAFGNHDDWIFFSHGAGVPNFRRDPDRCGDCQLRAIPCSGARTNT